MSKLRNAARGQDCLVRLPGVCNHNPETVVLAHLRMGGVSGTGQKPPDLVGCWACSACHDVIDQRVPADPGLKPALHRYILEGLCRTLAAVTRLGLVKA